MRLRLIAPYDSGGYVYGLHGTNLGRRCSIHCGAQGVSTTGVHGRQDLINYRRSEDWGAAQALYQQLAGAFSPDDLFTDVEGHIKPGDDFVKVLTAHVAACDVLLALIGPRWADLLAAGAYSSGRQPLRSAARFRFPRDERRSDYGFPRCPNVCELRFGR